MLINQERLLDTFRQLISINSPSRKEGAVAQVISSRLQKLGFDVIIDDAGVALGGETGNIIATLPANADVFHKLLFCSHMDTVAPTEGINIIEEDGIIRQEGAAVLGADDKGGIASILEGIESVVETDAPHGQIQVAILICEEIGLLGAKHLNMDLLDAEMGFVFDSGQPVGHIVTAAPTHDNLLISFFGKTAHAGVCPEEGINAIQAAALAITRMKLGRLDFESTSNAGIISGGTARNIVPEKCEIRAEARSRDPLKLEQQVIAMTNACKTAADETGARVEIEIERSYTGYKHPADAPLMQYAQQACESILMSFETREHGGGSDCNILNAKGLPSAVIGVGYEKIHTPEEFIRIADLVRCAELSSALVRVSAG